MTEQSNNKEKYYEIRDNMEINSPLDNAKRFYYLRKTCFRGMLNYNKKCSFTVGYFGYHKHCNFTDLKNEKYVDILKNTTILNSSFEYVFENYNDPKNFMLLDPPYDCKITDYRYSAFGKEEHKRLAECFKATSIRCLMIIGKTDFISELYAGYIGEEYGEKYDFNMDINKNVEGAIHLIIKNY
jgi:DNA adenine methylase